MMEVLIIATTARLSIHTIRMPKAQCLTRESDLWMNSITTSWRVQIHTQLHARRMTLM